MNHYQARIMLHHDTHRHAVNLMLLEMYIQYLQYPALFVARVTHHLMKLSLQTLNNASFAPL